MSGSSKVSEDGYLNSLAMVCKHRTITRLVEWYPLEVVNFMSNASLNVVYVKYEKDYLDLWIEREVARREE